MRPLQSSICCHISQTHRFGQVLCQLFAAWTLGAALLPGCSQASPTQPALPLRPSSPGSTPHTIPYYAPHHPQHSALLQPPAPRGAVQAIPLTRMLQQDSLRKGLKRTAPAEGAPPEPVPPPPPRNRELSLSSQASEVSAAAPQPQEASQQAAQGAQAAEDAERLALMVRRVWVWGSGLGVWSLGSAVGSPFLWGLELRVSIWEPYPMWQSPVPAAFRMGLTAPCRLELGPEWHG